jgi:hypothetical protein
MKAILLLVLMIFCFEFSNAQYNSRLEVYLGDGGMKTFSNYQVAPIHGFLNKDGYFIGEFDSENILKLINAEIPFEVIIDDLSKYYKSERTKQKIENVNSCFPSMGYYPDVQGFSTGSMGSFYILDEVLSELDNMYALYPNLITQKTQIGSSVSIEGRPIYWLKISDNPNASEDEPQVLYTAVHHSQEPASIQQLIHYMYYLLENYDSNPEVQYLINNTEMYFIPVVNPDGYVYNQTQNPDGGGMWRKNRRDNGGLLDGYGVDLNRNYAYAFAYDDIGSGSFGQHPWYRGENAFSEPETQAVKSFLESHNILIDVNWHSYGDMIIYPWNYENHYTDDSTFFEILAEEMSIENHYRSGTCYETYGYQSNGDADDWGYGETTSKNKIISLTAEVGNMDDGFWPDPSRIEDICRGTLRTNLSVAHMVNEYPRWIDLSSYIINQPSGEMQFELQNIGLASPANYVVNYIPISSNISFNPSSVSINGLNVLEKETGAIGYQITASPGEALNFVVSVNNGDFSFNDTVSKVFGYTEQLFYDPCENMTHWNADDWGVSENNPYDGVACITESNDGNYGLLQTSELEPDQSVNLADYTHAIVRFRIRYQSENNYDYLQFFASVDNGNSWQPLCGRHTKIGTDDEDEGQPVYHGNLPNWTYEEIILDDYVGQTVQFKFRFKSDQSHNNDGFYIDNFEVLALNPELVSIHSTKSEALTMFPNPTNGQIYFNNNTGRSVNIVISNILGKQIKAINCVGKECLIDCSNWTPGIYFWNSLELSNGYGKFIVQ